MSNMLIDIKASLDRELVPVQALLPAHVSFERFTNAAAVARTLKSPTASQSLTLWSHALKTVWCLMAGKLHWLFSIRKMLRATG